MALPCQWNEWTASKLTKRRDEKTEDEGEQKNIQCLKLAIWASAIQPALHSPGPEPQHRREIKNDKYIQDDNLIEKPQTRAAIVTD